MCNIKIIVGTYNNYKYNCISSITISFKAIRYVDVYNKVSEIKIIIIKCEKNFYCGGPDKSGAPKFYFANLPASCATEPR